MKTKYPQMRNSKTYNEYKLAEVLTMSPDAFGANLSNEIYSLVLVYRLLDLRAYFIESERYEYLIHIRNYFDEYSINYEDIEE